MINLSCKVQILRLNFDFWLVHWAIEDGEQTECDPQFTPVCNLEIHLFDVHPINKGIPRAEPNTNVNSKPYKGSDLQINKYKVHFSDVFIEVISDLVKSLKHNRPFFWKCCLAWRDYKSSPFLVENKSFNEDVDLDNEKGDKTNEKADLAQSESYSVFWIAWN